MQDRTLLTRAVRVAVLSEVLGATAGLMFMAPAPAQAQTAASGALEEVIVTARKRQEVLLDTPLSIQAFTTHDIESANLRNLEDVAAFTAGLSFQKLGNSQGGRYNSVIRFRGLELLTTGPQTQTGSLFVDGVRIAGGAGSITFNDIERIEVIRGPQSAYFGRGTFGGAINYVTLDPRDTFHGRLGAEYSPTYGSDAFNLSVDGPVAEGLTGRLSMSTRKRGAMWTATDGGKLGEERTDMLNGTLLWKPNDDLRVKVHAVYGEDSDGPPSTTMVPYTTYGNCPIGTPITVLTTTGLLDTTMRRAQQCGSIPYIPPTSNTTFYTVSTTRGLVNTHDILVKNTLGYPETGTPAMASFGLDSIFHLYTLSADYKFGEAWTLSGLFGYNKRDTTRIMDDDMQDSYGRVTKGFLELKAASGELRLNYDDGGKWRAMIGASYNTQDTWGDIDGGIGVLTNLLGQPAIGTEGGSVDIGEVKNTGFFGSVEYVAAEWLTLSFEGRYQVDKLTSTAGRYPGPYTTAPTEEYKDFLPRALATFKPFEGTTLYVSYAQGALPGSVNSAFLGLTPAEQAVVIATVPSFSLKLPSQTLDSYEIGWKQRLGETRSWFSLSAYKMDWKNVPAGTQVTFLSPSTGKLISTAVTLAGDAEVKGFEAEFQWLPLDQLDIRASVGYADATYTDFTSSSLNAYFGVPAGSSYKADGNNLPRAPKESAALSGTWTSKVSEEWDWYLRGDALYAGKAYTDESNLSWTPGYTVFNARVGFTRAAGLNIELFCTNCFDKVGWRTNRRGIDYADTSPLPNNLNRIGAISGPIERQEFGVRFQYDF